MSVKDIRSNLRQLLALNVAIATGASTNNGFGIDTADYDLGTMFNSRIAAQVATAGTVTFTIEHSDDDGVLDAYVEVTQENYIGDPNDMTIDTSTSAPDVLGTVLPTLGVFGNKRFVRLVATGVGITTGTITVDSEATLKAELMPNDAVRSGDAFTNPAAL